MESLRDVLSASEASSMSRVVAAGVMERGLIRGVFEVECRRPDGSLRWRDTIPNTVVVVGKNLILDMALAGAAYTALEYLGLISSVAFTGISSADTMGSHAGWLEAGAANAPSYTGSRGAMVWAAAAAGVKALSANVPYSITGNGTIKGCFTSGGPGVSPVIGNVGGVLVSAGLFTGGDRGVLAGDAVNVSYSMAI